MIPAAKMSAVETRLDDREIAPHTALGHAARATRLGYVRRAVSGG